MGDGVGGHHQLKTVQARDEVRLHVFRPSPLHPHIADVPAYLPYRLCHECPRPRRGVKDLHFVVLAQLVCLTVLASLVGRSINGTVNLNFAGIRQFHRQMEIGL